MYLLYLGPGYGPAMIPSAPVIPINPVIPLTPVNPVIPVNPVLPLPPAMSSLVPDPVPNARVVPDVDEDDDGLYLSQVDETGLPKIIQGIYWFYKKK